MKPHEITHVIYHANCFDGFGASWVAWLYRGVEAQYFAASYGDEPPALPSDAKVLIVDFSWPREVLLKMKSQVADLLVLDHHKSAQADLEGLDFAVFDMERSGAGMAMDFFYPAWREGFFNLLGSDLDNVQYNRAQFVLYLEDRDLWRFHMPRSREVHAALGSYPFEREIWSQLADCIGALQTEGHTIIHHMNRIIQNTCEHVTWRLIGGATVPTVNASCYFSETAEALCKKYPDAPFAAYWFARSDLVRWGLTTLRPDVDVSAIANQYGGGGHQRAAGFQTLKHTYFMQEHHRGAAMWWMKPPQ